MGAPIDQMDDDLARAMADHAANSLDAVRATAAQMAALASYPQQGLVVQTAAAPTGDGAKVYVSVNKAPSVGSYTPYGTASASPVSYLQQLKQRFDAIARENGIAGDR